MRKTICSMMFAAMLAVTGSALAAESNSEKPLEAAAIEKMAKQADTPAEHAEVARQYEWRGRSLEVKAQNLEREVRESKAPRSAMEHKWPAMVANTRERKEQMAMQARRAAEECFRLAQHHRNLAGDDRAAE